MSNEANIPLEKLTIIEHIPLFSGLSPAEIELIANSAEFIEYPKDEVVYNEGDAPSALYCIVTGRVKVYTTHHKKIEVLEYLNRTDYFGIISLLTGEVHSATAKVVNDTLILRIKKDKFDTILRQIPRLAVHFSSTLSRRLKRKDLGQKTIFESTIVSIYSVSEGVGRTLYALNLAASLVKETKKKVILLDVGADGGGVSKFLKIDDSLTALQLKTVFFYEDSIKKSIVRHESGMHLLKIARNSHAETEISQMANLLSFLTNEYHYIVVDLPVKMDDAVLKTITQSDLIHLLSDIKDDNIVSTNKLIQLLQKIIKDADDKINFIISESGGKIDNFDSFSYKIFATLPYIEGTEFNKGGSLFVLDSVNIEYAKAVRRISRSIGGVLIGLALGSGAALGLAHIGVIKILEREGIPVDVVAGSSIGALIAAFWAIGNNAQEMEKIAYASRRKVSLLSLRDLMFPTSGLISDHRVMNLLTSYLGEKTFRDVKLPLKISAIGFENREAIVIDSGKLVDAVRASISIPGVFKPKVKDGIHLIDGGILNPVPVSVLMRMGVKKIIAVNTLPSPADIQRSFELQQEVLKKEDEKINRANIFIRKIWKIRRRIRSIFLPNILDVIVGSMQSMEYRLAEYSCRQADVYIHPDTVGLNWSDFFNVQKAIKKGEEAAEKVLDEIKQIVL